MIRTLLIAAALFVVACAAPYTLPANDLGNMTQVINTLPPRVITAIARDGGVSEKVLRRDLAKLTRQATAKFKVVSFGMALDQAKFLTTPSGRPYGLIPTQTIVQAPSGTKLQSKTTKLTLEGGGEWYLNRIDEGRQIEDMREVYPDFKSVTFPKGTTKIIG